MTTETRARIPSYRLHRPSGQAIVTLNGRENYLGPWKTPESRQRYDRLIAEWMANGRMLLPKPEEREGLQMKDLMARFWTWSEGYYGATNGAKKSIRPALRPVRALYAELPVLEFGPLALRAVRDQMARTPTVRKTKKGIKTGPPVCRSEINRRIGVVKRMFKWGVENELVPPAVYQALAVVDGLRRGRCTAREKEPVGPVEEADFRKAVPHMPPPVQAMVELMWLAGMRPGEVVQMRVAELDMSGPAWLFRPGHHKTQHHGKDRAIALGPKAQEILKPYLKLDPQAPLFSPAEWLAKWRSDLTTTGAGAKKRKGNPNWQPTSCYTTASLGKAVRRACLKAGVPVFGVNRLRHSCATRLRKELGSLELVRTVLGHSDPRTSLIYAERDMGKAAEVMARLG